MQPFRSVLASVVVLLLVAASAPSAAQLPLDPMRESGQNVTAAYEGWYQNSDGSYSLLVGYFNRNHRQTLDIPVGPDNRIEPGGPDQGQPTHFLPRRQWGVFAIKVPADFPGKQLTWTLVVNGQTTEVPMRLNPLWKVEPLKDAAQGNTPPVVRFEKDGPPQQGPPEGIATSLDATLSQPATLKVWAEDDGLVDAYRRGTPGPSVTISWSKFRGPGEVIFENPAPEVDETGHTAVTSATFSEPGDYILRLQANDISGDGGGGAQCCWTNAHVKVTVTPGTSQ